MTTIKQCVLSTGQKVFYRSKADVDILSREMFQNLVYLRNGITLKDGDCIFDVGANIGFFLLQIGQLLREATVFCFEPITPIFEVLTRNAEQNCRLDYRLFNVGLSKSDCSAEFTYFPRTSVASTMYPDKSADYRRNSRRFVVSEMANRSGRLGGLIARMPGWLLYPLTEPIRRRYQAATSVSCRLRRLSDVIDEVGISRIELLKIDTEGAETDVLAGLESRHWELVQQLVVEVHHGIESRHQMEKILQDRGFSTTSEPVLAGVDHLHVVFARR